jgi:hypothetical protein
MRRGMAGGTQASSTFIPPDPAALGLPQLSVVDDGSGQQVATYSPWWVDQSDPLQTAVAELLASRSRDRDTPPPARSWREWLASIRVGAHLDWHGTDWRLRVIDNHILLAGETGAGKSGVLWALIVGLAPAIMAGVAQIWAIDPKLMELYPGRGCFERYADDEKGSLELLEDAVMAMEQRARTVRQYGEQTFTPSSETPLAVILIDELADILEMEERKLSARAELAVRRLLRKGRAPGFVVVGATQDPRKDVVRDRDRYQTRIALRMERPIVDLVLGQGAYENGAECDLIPMHPTGAGIGYFIDKERGNATTKVRAFRVHKEDIAQTEKKVAAALKAARADRQQGAGTGQRYERRRPRVGREEDW